MIKVSIIGSGNVAQHLIKAFLKTTEVELIQVYSRKSESVSHLVNPEKITQNLSDLRESDIYILAISDDAIADVSAQLPFSNRLVVHTSGSVAMNALDDKNRKGVFYPLQTFSKNKEIDFSVIPINLESQNSEDYTLLEKLAHQLSEKVFPVNSEQRKALHVSAVFVCNFVNHLYQIGNEICDEHQLPFEILLPLIQETAQKVKELSPENAQTGPAKRSDLKTIESHLSFLNDENQKNIYQILTKSIQSHVKEL
ncbi:MAG: Rossmann-like and DUF2520 domain-containing protein [Flavobacterium sp.]